MQYNTRYLYDTFMFNNTIHQVYLIKTHDHSTNKDDYYLKIYEIKPNNEEILAGYLYFFINETEKQTSYIGTFVNPSYRNQKIASLLLSIWIKLGLDNGYSLTVNRKQRKPFLLYLLKKFTFEIDNLKLYETYDKIISICQKDSSAHKYLYFKDKKQKEQFSQGKIMQNDDYYILDEITTNTKVLDQVILTKRYNLTNPNQAYQKAETTTKKFK